MCIRDSSICGQLLVTPVADADLSRTSYNDNAEGYILTRSLMEWFWDHYCDVNERDDPRASPIKAESLEGLPPAMVVTAELDPLRDEGNAYAEAMSTAGVEVQHKQAPGQIHTSITAVDMIVSSEGVREKMCEAISGFFN